MNDAKFYGDYPNVKSTEKKNVSIGFIGAGKVACSLGKWFSMGGLRLSGYASRTHQSAAFAARFTESQVFEDVEDLLISSDIIFLTANDGELRGLYQSLDENIIQNKILVHCSGSLTVKEVFGERSNCFSLHPLYPFSSKTDCYKGLSGSFFTLEAADTYSKESASLIEDMVKGCGGNISRIEGDKKSIYHASCVFASNLVCAVLEESCGLMEECGFKKEEAINALAPLIRANIDSSIKLGPENALTGPVERNDSSTVEKHLDALAGSDSLEVYRVLSKKLVEIGKARHPDRDYAKIRSLLE